MPPRAPSLGADYAVPDEEQLERSAARQREEYLKLIRRLNHQSVVKHFDAYADIDWDSPEFAIDPDDPRWALDPDGDSLAATAWYQGQPALVQSRIGLHMFATFMKIGVTFESVLKRGLLEFAATLPNGSPEFRYAYHEVIEESQHSLMFQEFVNRSGLTIGGLGAFDQWASRFVIGFGRSFPELFFVFVLAGEDPIDHVQRQFLQTRRSDAPPLLHRIMQIHVTEEARHLSFARHFLRLRVPELSWLRRAQLSFRVPLILAEMARLMMEASPDIVRTYTIPPEVVREAYRDNPDHRRRMLASLAKLRRLCVELEIVNRPSLLLWKQFGLWPDGETLPAAA
jgi:hypothetical protein